MRTQISQLQSAPEKREAGGRGYERRRSPEGGAGGRRRAAGRRRRLWCWRPPRRRRRCARPAVAAQAGHRGAAAAGSGRLVGRGLAGLLRRAGGIAEFDGGLPRRAGRGARLRLLRRRMAQPQPGALAAGRCCSAAAADDQADDPLLPFGVDAYRPCLAAFALLAAWHEHRRRPGGYRRLAAMGIAAPSEFPNDFGKNGGA